MTVRQSLWMFLCLNLLILPFQNCTPSHLESASNSNSSLGGYSYEDLAGKFSETLQPILRANCRACHGSFQHPMFAVEDPLAAVRTIDENRLADLGNPDKSYYLQKIRTGHNGFTEELAQTVRTGIVNWANAMKGADVPPPPPPPPPDETGPVVTLTNPANGAVVAGSLTISATAIDESVVEGVQFYLNGLAIGAEDDVEPFELVIDTMMLSEGQHTLQARARDKLGNVGLSAVHTITVDNVADNGGGGDNEPVDGTSPTVEISSPQANASLSGTVVLSATASDNVGVVGVQFFVNGSPVGAEDTSSPYQASWNTTLVANGTHQITARARDAAGNQRTSTAVSVTVNNAVLNPNATFTWISANILQPRCISCHGTGKAESGIRYNTYANTMSSVRVGNPTNSQLYRQTNNGNMPENGSKLTSVQIQAIYDWILSGAPNN